MFKCGGIIFNQISYIVGNVLGAVSLSGMQFHDALQCLVYVVDVEVGFVVERSIETKPVAFRRSVRETSIIHKIESVISRWTFGNFVEINDIGILVVVAQCQRYVGQWFARFCDIVCVPAVILAKNLHWQ